MKTLALVFVISSLVACSREPASSPASSTPSSSATASAPASSPAASLPAGMVRVTDPSQVCMMNDQFMGKPQIPVEVEGRTYYGCCAMCKDKLEQQPATRTAQDPVTGEPVDKANAVIIQDSSGRVKYFASEDTLRRYRG